MADVQPDKQADDGATPPSVLDAASDIGDGDGTPPGDDGADGAAAAAADKDASKAQQGERPDWLKDDKFWDGDKKAVKADLIHQNLQELQTKFSRGEHKGPEKPEQYKHGLDEETAKTFLHPGEDGTPDPLLAWAQGFAHSKGLNQGDFKEMIEGFTKAAGPLMPEMEPPYDPVKEVAKIGKNGQAVVDAMATKCQGFVKSGVFNDQDVQEFRIACGTAEGVRMMQKVFEFYEPGSVIPVDVPDHDGLPSADELREMLNSEKYEKDAAYREKVDGLYAKRYGTAPAGSSRVLR